MKASLVIAAAIAALSLSPAPASSRVAAGFGPCFWAAEDPTNRRPEICTRALARAQLAADRASHYVNRSIIRVRAGDATGALDDCDRALELLPGMAEALANRGLALYALRRFPEAVEALDDAIEGGVRKPEVAHYDRALAKEGMGDIRGAYFDFKAALDLDPGFTRAERQLKRFRVRTVPFNPA